MAQVADERIEATRQWWATEIIDIHAGKIGVRGYPIQELIGKS